MKTLIWIVFYISIAGMFLSAALRTVVFREIIIEAWMITTQRLEKLPYNFSISVLTKLLNVFYCKTNNKLSFKKNFIISLVTNIAWYLFTMTFYEGKYKLSDNIGFKTAIFIHILIIIANIPQFLAIEYIQANIMIKVFNKIKNKNIYFVSCVFLIFVVLFYAVSFFVLIYVRDIAPINDQKTYIGIFLPFIYPSAFLLLWINTSMMTLTKMFFMLPFVLTLINGLILILFALLISNSKITLSLLAKSIEKISTKTYSQLFNSSLILFTIATGLMQAYTF